MQKKKFCIHSSQKLKTIQVSINSRADTQDVIELNNGMFLGAKKQWNIDARPNVGTPETIMLSEWSQTQMASSHGGPLK